MPSLVKLLVTCGLMLLIAGGVVWLLSRLGIQRLPGDLEFKRGDVTFSFPIVTCIVVSIVLTIVLNLFTRK